MVQGFFSALFTGAKEVQSARTIIKFVAYYGFITMGLALVIIFAPYQPLQDVINEALPHKLAFASAAFISFVCCIFLLKGKFWAPCILIALTLADMIFSYMETGDYPRSMSSIKLLLFISAAQAIYFLNKNKSNPAEKNTEELPQANK